MATEATGLTAKCRFSVGHSIYRDCGRDASEMIVSTRYLPGGGTEPSYEPRCPRHMAAFRRRKYQFDTVIEPVNEACVAYWEAQDEAKRQAKAERARKERVQHEANVRRWTAQTQEESKVIYEARHQPRSRYGGDPDKPRWVVVPIDWPTGQERGLGDGADVEVTEMYGEVRLEVHNGNRLTISEAEALTEALRLAVAKAKES